MDTRRLSTTCLAVVVVLLTAALPPRASAGEYSVRLTSTAPAHWTTHGGPPFIVSTDRVASGKGVFSSGDYRSWRVHVVGTGSRIVGGRVRVQVTTPNAHMRARIVAGTGSSSVVIDSTEGEGVFERAIPAGPFDWAQFDISSVGAVTTSGAGQDHVDLQFVDLQLRDDVPPVLQPIDVPAPSRWFPAGACIPFTIRLTDQGGGLQRSQVRRAGDGAVVTTMGATMVESPRPGPTEQQLSDCIAPSERGHGDTTFIATAWDVSGVARELAFMVRADQLAPTIVGGPASGARFTTARPTISFDVADQGSGLAAVSATLDGAPVAVTTAGGTASLATGELARGQHVVAMRADDAAGNATIVERAFVVADDTPPQLALTSPGARGDATARVTARASDDMSGVDPTSWSLVVDDGPVAFSADGATLSASIGPLTAGTHRIEVAVRDNAGNRSTANADYYVVPPPAKEPVAAAQQQAPGRSGAYLVDSPRAAVGFGRAATSSIQVVRNGEAVVGQRVTVRRDGHDLASSVTDADGVARVTVSALRPGRYDAIADGMGYAPVVVPLRVAPRITIGTSTLRPRVGRRVRIAGRIFPALRGRVVSVEARVGGVWFPVRRTARTNVAGRFATTVVSAAPGPIHVRVKLKPAGAWAGAVSNVRLLRVRR